jgi:hypothetical protein
MLACACGGGRGAEDAVGASHAPRRGAIEFSYDSLDERLVNSKATRGRPTVLAFVATYDLKSQAQVDYVAAMAKHDGDHVNYAVVALEIPENRELVETFRKFVESKFGVSLTTAMADPATIAGAGPFGDVHVVPTVVVLDREGNITWQHTGLAKSDDIRAGMRGL